MKRKLFPLLLLPVLSLTACGGDLKVEPSQIKNENSLVSFFDKDKNEVDVDVYNNLNSIIYNAKLDNGTIAKDVLNDVLYELAKSVYGDFKELNEVAGKTANEAKAFIDSHKVYHTIGEDNKRVENDLNNEFIRLQLTAKRIEERIANKFFTAIKGSYTRDGAFFEEDYLMSLRSSLKDVAKPAPQSKGVIIPPEFDGKDVFKAEDGKEPLLHKEYYTGDYKYMEKDIIPEIYRELLVEQYLFDKNYSTIARAYAREVEIITINNRADDSNAAKKLMNAYVDNFINTNKQFAEGHEPSFKIIATAWRGYNLPAVGNIDGTIEEQATFLLEQAGFKKNSYKNSADLVVNFGAEDIPSFYEGTSYGSLIKNLEKIKKDAKTTDVTIENEFTNNGEYTVERGFETKEVKVQQETYITDGWHIRNGGLSSLNEKIRTRLFNIGVANALDKEHLPAEQQYPDRIGADGKVHLDIEENPYVAKVNGRYFLKPSLTEKDNERDMIWYDESADSFTIVEIKNAVSSSKLARNADGNYEHRVAEGHQEEGFRNMETIAHAVAYEVAKGESYRSLSTKSWLEAADMEFHDTKILEYFETNYPELFEEK